MSSRNSGPSKEAQRIFGGKAVEPADRDAAFAREQARQRQAVDEKSNRLRALRLAKEAADREAALLNPAPKKSRSAAIKKVPS
jgi:hypothetical protein